MVASRALAEAHEEETMPAEKAPTLKLLKQAVREIFVYLLLSFVLLLANSAVYVTYFVIAQPKYTFLTGNSLLAALLVIECGVGFYVTCIRKKVAPDLTSFRFATACVFTGVLILYGLHATVFTIVERSVSINVLRYLMTGESQPYDSIEKNFIATFVLRDKAVCKRLDEQIHLGNVAVENGRYTITPKGVRTFTILDSATHVTADKNPKNAVSCHAD
jgi:hypothetical protein